MKFIIILVLFMYNFAQASDTFFCESGNIYVYKGVTCCQDRVLAVQCELLVNKYLDSSLLFLINRIHHLSVSEMNFANCTWLAMSFYFTEFRNNTHQFNAKRLKSILQRKFTKISESTIQSGDLVLFYENFTSWQNTLNSGRDYFIFKNEIVNHAAIYLEDGIIFQKESMSNFAFSIDYISFVESNILKWVKTTPETKDQSISKEFFTLKR